MHKFKKIVMLTNDTKVDRRILLEANSLRTAGYEVIILAMANEDYSVSNEEIVRTALVENSFNKNKKDIAYRLYYQLRDFLYHYPSLHRTMHFLAWGIVWLKLCFKNKKIFFTSPPELFFDQLFLDKAIDLKGDIYVAHDLPMLATAAKAAKATGAKLVYDSHEIYPEQCLIYPEKLMWRHLERKYIHEAHAVITVNPSLADEFKKTFKNINVNVIYNAENIITLPTIQPKLFHQHFNLQPDTKVILYQGGLYSDRNLLNLVNAMQYVSENICLVLLGDGKLDRKIKKVIESKALQNKVFLHAAVPQTELLAYTMSADVGVIPYQSNCLNNKYCTPNKLFEFIIAELPIIATDLPELRNIVFNNKIGLVANLKDEKNIAHTFDQFFEEQHIAKQFKNNLAIVRQKINWANEAKKLTKIYQSLD